MRDQEIIEAELMEISAIADDTIKFERMIVSIHRQNFATPVTPSCFPIHFSGHGRCIGRAGHCHCKSV